MDNWISVKDKLPQDDSDCLIYDATSNITLVGWYDIGDKVWEDCRGFIYCDEDDITHWQPLPQPPKGE